MQSKRFRNQQFYKGDLVAPTWNPRVPYGLGVIVDIDYDIINSGITTPSVGVYWQNGLYQKEHLMDIKVVEQALD